GDAGLGGRRLHCGRSAAALGILAPAKYDARVGQPPGCPPIEARRGRNRTTSSPPFRNPSRTISAVIYLAKHTVQGNKALAAGGGSCFGRRRRLCCPNLR